MWQPSFSSRIKTLFRKGLRQLTLGRTAVIVLVLPLLFYICREVFWNRPLIIDPFSVPKAFEDAGLTPDVIADKVGDALHEIESEAQTRLKKDNLKLLKEEASVPNIELPGTKLGLKEVIEVTRSVLNIYPPHVSGDIVATNTEKSANPGKLNVTIYLTQNDSRREAATIPATSDSIDGLAKDAAKVVLRQINPYILATYEYDQSHFEEASGVLEEMIRSGCGKDREHAVAALNLKALILMRKNQFAAAEHNLKQANECKKTAIVYTNLGIVQFEQQQFDAAIDSYHHALARDSQNANIHNSLGAALAGKGDFDQAVAEYREATQLDLQNANAYNNWAIALAKQKKYGEAAAKFEMAASHSPNDASIYESWGLALYQNQSYSAAADKYEKVTQLDPNNTNAYIDWGSALMQQKQFGEAAKRYEQAVRLDPGNPAIHNYLGQAFEFDGKKDKATYEYAVAKKLSQKAQ